MDTSIDPQTRNSNNINCDDDNDDEDDDDDDDGTNVTKEKYYSIHMTTTVPSRLWRIILRLPNRKYCSKCTVAVGKL